jgi:hypothetical protein
MFMGEVIYALSARCHFDGHPVGYEGTARVEQNIDQNRIIVS